MKIFGKTTVLFMIMAGIACQAQESYKIQGKKLLLSNGKITRSVVISNDSIFSDGLALQGRTANYFRGRSPEFQFLLNDKKITSYSSWEKRSIESASDNNGGKGAILRLKGKGQAEGIELSVTYLMYPDIPLIRKKISFRNGSDTDMKLEAIDIEAFNLNFDYVSAWIYNNYARMKHIGPFTGNWDDPVVVIHSPGQRAGIAVGNEAPGVLKRTAFNTANANVEAGLTHPGQDFPFRKWLKPGETFETDDTFIALYSGTDNGFDVINTVVNDYVRLYMGTRLTTLKNKPLFVYNTWYPFRTFVSDSLVRKVAKAAAECGVQEFIIDDGWQYNYGRKSSDKGWGGNYGDWLVDRNKFPDDLSSTFDYIKSLGMKPGLWISVGSATSDAKVYKDHPEWFVVNKAGKTGNLHLSSGTENFYTSCFGTEWIGYIKKAILDLAKNHGLAYAKLDFSILTSAYVNDPEISGCYAKNHPYHRDHEESFIVIYRNVLKLFDELHEEAPELFIDCTFETAGKLQLQDYAFAKHAEGNWLSNVEEPAPVGSLRVRQLAWWRSPALPAGSLVIGNLPLDSKNLDFDFKSLLGTLPIMLGDPRKLTPDKRAEMKKWADWMVRMQKEYDYMSFRQDLPGFGEPAEGSWDGWTRINTDSKEGGIIGVFRQGARDNSRSVFITNLDPEKKYKVLLAPEGKEVAMLTGKQLASDGFKVSFTNAYEGRIFELKHENETGASD
jgi:alpha-galactosidase